MVEVWVETFAFLTNQVALTIILISDLKKNVKQSGI